MVLSDGQREVITPEFPDSVRIIFTVLINIQVDPGSLSIDVLRYFSGRIKRLCVSEIVHELCKGSSHFIRIIRREVLIL